MEKKRTHTIEEIDELKNWFIDNKDKLPQTMQIDSSAFTPDLKETIDMLFDQAYICYENPKMQGCILILKKIKKNIEELYKKCLHLIYNASTFLLLKPEVATDIPHVSKRFTSICFFIIHSEVRSNLHILT